MKFRKFISLSAALMSVSLGISALPCSAALSLGEPTRTLYEQSKSAINRRFCYNMEKDSVKLIVKAHE